MENNKTVQTEKGKITVTEVKASKFQRSGTLTAIIKQRIKTVTQYKNKPKSSGLFSTDEFKATESSFENISTRVVFELVPEGTTLELVQQRLDGTDACIVNSYAHSPILSDSQKDAVEKGLTSLEIIAESQLIKDDKGNPALMNGLPQFKRSDLSLSSAEDNDLRDSKDVFIPISMREEESAKASTLDEII